MPDEEEWREVPAHDGLLASSWGRLLLPPVSYRMPNGGHKTTKPRPVCGAWDGVRFILRWRNRGTFKVARLVCLAFHGEPPEGRPNCLHIDEDSRNNRPENLMWGTQEENLNAPGFLDYCRGRTGDSNPYVKGRKS